MNFANGVYNGSEFTLAALGDLAKACNAEQREHLCLPPVDPGGIHKWAEAHKMELQLYPKLLNFTVLQLSSVGAEDLLHMLAPAYYNSFRDALEYIFYDGNHAQIVKGIELLNYFLGHSVDGDHRAMELLERVFSAAEARERDQYIPTFKVVGEQIPSEWLAKYLHAYHPDDSQKLLELLTSERREKVERLMDDMKKQSETNL
jgi:hypothetical protein